MGTERGGCSRLMKTPRHGGGAYIKQEHENKEKGQPLQWLFQKARKELLNSGN